MNGLGHYYVLQGYISYRTTWANWMKFGMKHAPVAGSIALTVFHRTNFVLRLSLPVDIVLVLLSSSQAVLCSVQIRCT